MLAEQYSTFNFTFDNLKNYFRTGLDNGYQVITCADYINYKAQNKHHKIIVNRVDIDVSVKKAGIIAEIFNQLGIKATFFIRLHANEYNPFSFENYKILKKIRDAGHEIGYHSEVNDQAAIWHESAEGCLRRDISILESMLGIKILGVASHGGMTGLNNLDFWKHKKPKDFNLLYEAYDQEPAFDLFNNSLYISDSSWTFWKCYKNGKLIENDRQTLGDHLRRDEKIIYSLIHPETYYYDHFYE